MSARIAIVGMACRYPDAASPSELWENVLAGRRAFRRLPDERMNRADYWSPDPAAPDRFYASQAAVLEGYEFDRLGFRIAGSTYRSTDLTHWLALDIAAQAMADAGYRDGAGLPRTSTGVIVGNSLTGEFARAALMRLRWPYVQRVVGTALRAAGWADDRLGPFLRDLEESYKSPFPPVNEDTLAGGLSNTIAGRICNHFDLRGGGYTVDGACSSSLLSVATACRALVDGELDVAIAGGVDLSIDPFEVIGFAKTGALATGEMRVYDRGSNGFWPGEGCGMVVLMREADAHAEGRAPYAYVAGWGVSSDGKGGITRPEAAGHQLAVDRAYARAGFGIDTVSLLEGHGTGTAVGDATELRALSAARRAADPEAPLAAIGTVKGNIGHTKAAAGIAGVIKATLAAAHRVIPPATSHVDPHPELLSERSALRVPTTVEQWPAGRPVRVGVSSMGFGGINTHVVLEAPEPHQGRGGEMPIDVARRAVASRQDVELLLLDGDTVAEVRARALRLAEVTERIAYAELADLGATLHAQLAGRPVRAAVVAGSPQEASHRLAVLADRIGNGAMAMTEIGEGVFLGRAGRQPVVGYLFPGQGSGRSADGGLLRRRFSEVEALYRDVAPVQGGDQVATEVAQPRIVTASLAGLRVLHALGITATRAAGHSLGEFTAAHWAGAMDEAQLLRVVAARGAIMGAQSHGGGVMASVAAGPDAVAPLLCDTTAVIAGYNGPRQTVVSGAIAEVERVEAAAKKREIPTTRVPVSHAFHSELIRPAADSLAELLGGEDFAAPGAGLMSTVTGHEVEPGAGVRDLLRAQALRPVRFAEAAGRVADGADLVIEVGPGRVLSGLLEDLAPGVPVVSLECGGRSLRGLLSAVGAAYVLGVDVRHDRLFADRFTRPFEVDREPVFLASPCERAPRLNVDVEPSLEPAEAAPADGPAGEDTVDLLVRLAAERAELPVSIVSPDSLPLDELHLSSITVGQIMNDAARARGLAPPQVGTSFATSTLRELAGALDELAATGRAGDGATDAVAGVADWVRSYTVDWIEAPSPAAAPTDVATEWTYLGAGDHPWATPLRAALRDAAVGPGVLLCLPTSCDAGDVETMLAAAHAALAVDGPGRFAVVQHGRGATGLAKSLHLEAPQVATAVLIVPPGVPSAGQVARAVADIVGTDAFAEIRYDGDVRRAPVLTAAPPVADADRVDPCDATDVVLVTGGGKGITAECALALARDTGARLGLLGRADPERDAELAANLERMSAAGVTYRYLRADVTDADQVAAAVDALVGAFGPVTAVLHGAGRNEPRALASLTPEAFRATLAPKVDGLRAVLAAVDVDRLRLLLTFGSIIGRAGLRGEGDYATANDWMTDLTVAFGREHPHVRCVAMEWSVWSGAGMGERLGVVESLIRDGITPIAPDQGIQALLDVLADPRRTGAVVITARVQGLATIRMADTQLPLLRFTDRPRIWYPGVELVADAELSSATDPYLDDHTLDGSMLFPAVIGMEAMAQAASAVSGRTEPPVLENVEFLRPIVVQPGNSTLIRVAVLTRGTDTVDAVIRSAETGFEVDHFRARLRYPAGALGGCGPDATGLPPVAIDPLRELYGGMLFQGKRFQRLIRYQQLAARSARADIAVAGSTSWFGTFLPQDMLLGDPGARDAFMHSIQSCVPDATLLPVAVQRLVPYAAVTGDGQVTMCATERSHSGDTYVYDVDVYDGAGVLVERWTSLKLQAVRKQGGRGPWVAALLGPYLQRQILEVADVEPVAVVVEPDRRGGPDGQLAGRELTALALRRALGSGAVIRHRPDGRPEAEGAVVSSSHGAGVTFGLVGTGPLAGDVQAVPVRADTDWDALLGPQRGLADRLVADTGEPLALAATRVWTVIECVRKSGCSIIGRPAIDRYGPDGWAVFALGDLRILTFTTTLTNTDGDVVFAVLTGRRS